MPFMTIIKIVEDQKWHIPDLKTNGKTECGKNTLIIDQMQIGSTQTKPLPNKEQLCLFCFKNS